MSRLSLLAKTFLALRIGTTERGGLAVVAIGVDGEAKQGRKKVKYGNLRGSRKRAEATDSIATVDGEKSSNVDDKYEFLEEGAAAAEKLATIPEEQDGPGDSGATPGDGMQQQQDATLRLELQSLREDARTIIGAWGVLNADPNIPEVTMTSGPVAELRKIANELTSELEKESLVKQATSSVIDDLKEQVLQGITALLKHAKDLRAQATGIKNAVDEQLKRLIAASESADSDFVAKKTKYETAQRQLEEANAGAANAMWIFSQFVAPSDASINFNAANHRSKKFASSHVKRLAESCEQLRQVLQGLDIFVDTQTMQIWKELIVDTQTIIDAANMVSEDIALTQADERIDREHGNIVSSLDKVAKSLLRLSLDVLHGLENKAPVIENWKKEVQEGIRVLVSHADDLKTQATETQNAIAAAQEGAPAQALEINAAKKQGGFHSVSALTKIGDHVMRRPTPLAVGQLQFDENMSKCDAAQSKLDETIADASDAMEIFTHVHPGAVSHWSGKFTSSHLQTLAGSCKSLRELLKNLDLPDLLDPSNADTALPRRFSRWPWVSRSFEQMTQLRLQQASTAAVWLNSRLSTSITQLRVHIKAWTIGRASRPEGDLDFKSMLTTQLDLWKQQEEALKKVRMDVVASREWLEERQFGGLLRNNLMTGEKVEAGPLVDDVAELESCVARAAMSFVGVDGVEGGEPNLFKQAAPEDENLRPEEKKHAAPEEKTLVTYAEQYTAGLCLSKGVDVGGVLQKKKKGYTSAEAAAHLKTLRETATGCGGLASGATTPATAAARLGEVLSQASDLLNLTEPPTAAPADGPPAGMPSSSEPVGDIDRLRASRKELAEKKARVEKSAHSLESASGPGADVAAEAQDLEHHVARLTMLFVGFHDYNDGALWAISKLGHQKVQTLMEYVAAHAESLVRRGTAVRHVPPGSIAQGALDSVRRDLEDAITPNILRSLAGKCTKLDALDVVFARRLEKVVAQAKGLEKLANDEAGWASDEEGPDVHDLWDRVTAAEAQLDKEADEEGGMSLGAVRTLEDAAARLALAFVSEGEKVLDGLAIGRLGSEAVQTLAEYATAYVDKVEKRRNPLKEPSREWEKTKAKQEKLQEAAKLEWLRPSIRRISNARAIWKKREKAGGEPEGTQDWELESQNGRAPVIFRTARRKGGYKKGAFYYAIDAVQKLDKSSGKAARWVGVPRDLEITARVRRRPGGPKPSGGSRLAALTSLAVGKERTEAEVECLGVVTLQQTEGGSEWKDAEVGHPSLWWWRGGLGAGPAAALPSSPRGNAQAGGSPFATIRRNTLRGMALHLIEYAEKVPEDYLDRITPANGRRRRLDFVAQARRDFAASRTAGQERTTLLRKVLVDAAHFLKFLTKASAPRPAPLAETLRKMPGYVPPGLRPDAEGQRAAQLLAALEKFEEAGDSVYSRVVSGARHSGGDGQAWVEALQELEGSATFLRTLHIGAFLAPPTPPQKLAGLFVGEQLAADVFAARERTAETVKELLEGFSQFQGTQAPGKSAGQETVPGPAGAPQGTRWQEDFLCSLRNVESRLSGAIEIVGPALQGDGSLLSEAERQALRAAGFQSEAETNLYTAYQEITAAAPGVLGGREELARARELFSYAESGLRAQYYAALFWAPGEPLPAGFSAGEVFKETKAPARQEAAPHADRGEAGDSPGSAPMARQEPEHAPDKAAPVLLERCLASAIKNAPPVLLKGGEEKLLRQMRGAPKTFLQAFLASVGAWVTWVDARRQQALSQAEDLEDLAASGRADKRALGIPLAIQLYAWEVSAAAHQLKERAGPHMLEARPADSAKLLASEDEGGVHLRPVENLEDAVALLVLELVAEDENAGGASVVGQLGTQRAQAILEYARAYCADGVVATDHWPQAREALCGWKLDKLEKFAAAGVLVGQPKKELLTTDSGPVSSRSSTEQGVAPFIVVRRTLDGQARDVLNFVEQKISQTVLEKISETAAKERRAFIAMARSAITDSPAPAEKQALRRVLVDAAKFLKKTFCSGLQKGGSEEGAPGPEHAQLRAAFDQFQSGGDSAFSWVVDVHDERAQSASDDRRRVAALQALEYSAEQIQEFWHKL
ncbi:unnamed protein product [Amoebophrya sp. A120]|nr:unnamed protein product [Amoebophrya sp. A120]|eukprot:GSA120T00019311001.1